ncbi:hypothetical protein RAC90_05320 [Pantoea sp. CS_6]|uniref:hypothetical protein n=1 Tax=Pantoea sp. CS_6 TaxID=3055795 RepID=UPI0035C19866
MPFKLKVVVWIVGGILGVYIPTSMLGLTLHNGMFTKQIINCDLDVVNSLTALSNDNEHLIQGSDFERIGTNLKSCVKHLDYNKGMVSFLREEHARYRNDMASLR